MKDKKWFFKALRMMLDWHETYRVVLELTPEQAMDKTLETYSDFYEVFMEKKLSNNEGEVNN